MITQDDIIYMIVTDRFADGDPGNNADVEPNAPKGRHGGDLLGIIQRLPYLRALGVTALWITPVYRNPPGAYHGYHPLDFEQVDPHLCSPELGPVGDREVVRRFIEIAHEQGLKVVLDLVVNHTARNHPWLTERPGWFNRNPTEPDQWDAYKWWVWGLPDLNHDNVDVNAYFIRNVLDWISVTKPDGVRLDAARHVETQFWHQFKLFAQGFHPEVTLLSEVWSDRVDEVAPYQAVYGFDSVFDFPLRDAAVAVFAHDAGFGRIACPQLYPGETPGVLNLDSSYRNAFQLITFLENHDTPRFFHLAGGAENPDEATARTYLALTFLFTTRGIPQLYYGAELAMDGGENPDCRRDMPWSLVSPEPEFVPAGEPARAIYTWTQKLIGLRRASLALRYGFLNTLYLTPTLYAYARMLPGEVCIVVLNNGTQPAQVCIPLRANPRIPAIVRDELSDGLTFTDALHPERQAVICAGSLDVTLPARSGALFMAAAGEPLLALD